MLTPPKFLDIPVRHDDPRLNEVALRYPNDFEAVESGRAVLVGFPVDEGVRRNGGRTGAAQAPDAIREWLYRLTPTDAPAGIDLRDCPPLDLGNLRPLANLESSQGALASIVAELLTVGAVPIILGGGHETAFGHYLAYCKAGIKPGVINLDAHLDVRPPTDGLGTSGTSFRQMMDYMPAPLQPGQYACLGIQPQSVSLNHWEFCRRRGDLLITADSMRHRCQEVFAIACSDQFEDCSRIYLSVDADVVCAADVPGVSAPNAAGLSGQDLLCCARQAGIDPRISGLDLVEINPAYDLDGRSARWAATMVWQFLMGLAIRRSAGS
jgi:formiminoglutamase